ncbi:MAG TPA: HepT-like ribonuclease domain-containing protein [Rhizobiaceae bacterium]|nr:HepT-like ribonuclease domain-containing protein [Rhizobiaceae bacterium]
MKPERRIAHRFLDILEAIDAIRSILAGETFEAFRGDRLKRPAVERYLEIISEASRHIPDAVKSGHGGVPWQKIAGLGNILRHDYPDTNPSILWDIYKNHLTQLEDTIRQAQPDYPEVDSD